MDYFPLFLKKIIFIFIVIFISELGITLLGWFYGEKALVGLFYADEPFIVFSYKMYISFVGVIMSYRVGEKTI